MHVISASRRTDIPAFHASWFMNRIRSGFVKVKAPFSSQLNTVSLRPEDTIAIVFWTKNASPALSYLNELKELGYPFTFLYTINNYPAFLEPLVPQKSHSLKVAETIAKGFGHSAFRWRYDTIVLCEGVDCDWHIRNFRELCSDLSLYTRECIFSFCDYYKKTIRNMESQVQNYRIPSNRVCVELAEMMADIASEYGMNLLSCAHDFLVSPRIRKAHCVDSAVLKDLVDSIERLEAIETLKISPTRKGCGCLESKDIGAYDTCAHGCAYCYANADTGLARRNLLRISPDADCLALPGSIK